MANEHSSTHAGVIRSTLEESLPSTDDLDAFVLTCFPSVHRLFSAGMTRTQKLNLLIERESSRNIKAELAGFLAQAARSSQIMAALGPSPTQPAGARWRSLFGLSALISLLSFALQAVWSGLKRLLIQGLKVVFATGGAATPATVVLTAGLAVGTAAVVAPEATKSAFQGIKRRIARPPRHDGSRVQPGSQDTPVWAARDLAMEPLRDLGVAAAFTSQGQDLESSRVDLSIGSSLAPGMQPVRSEPMGSPGPPGRSTARPRDPVSKEVPHEKEGESVPMFPD